MIIGVFVGQDGSVQEIGNITSYKLIIQAMQQAIPYISKLEEDRLLDDLSVEKLRAMLKTKTEGEKEKE